MDETKPRGKPGPKSLCPDLDLVRELAASGLRQTQIYQRLGLCTTTWYKYIRIYPELANAVREGERAAIELAEHDLLTIAKDVNNKPIERVQAYKTWLQYHPKVKVRDRQEILDWMLSLSPVELATVEAELMNPSASARFSSLSPLDAPIDA